MKQQLHVEIYVYYHSARYILSPYLIVVGKSSDVNIARLEKAVDTQNFPMKANTVAPSPIINSI